MGWRIGVRSDRAVGAQRIRIPIGHDTAFGGRALAGLAIIAITAARATAVTASAAIAAHADD